MPSYEAVMGVWLWPEVQKYHGSQVKPNCHGPPHIGNHFPDLSACMHVSAVVARLLSLSNALDVDVVALAALARGQGQLLLASPQSLRAKLAVIGKHLGLGDQEVVELAAQEPKLMCR